MNKRLNLIQFIHMTPSPGNFENQSSGKNENRVSENVQKKVDQYTAEILKGEDMEKVLQGQGPYMRGLVEEALKNAESNLDDGDKTQEQTVDNSSIEGKVGLYVDRIIYGRSPIEYEIGGGHPEIRKEVLKRIQEEAVSIVDDMPIPKIFSGMSSTDITETWPEKKQVTFDDVVHNTMRAKAIFYVWNIEKQEQDKKKKAAEQDRIAELSQDLGGKQEKPTTDTTPKQESTPKDIQPEKPIELAKKYEPGKSIELDKNVERKHTQEIFGDLNGSYKSFVEHLLNRDLITFENGAIKWTGKDTHVVFIGDITGDRNMEGLKIYRDLKRLQRQATQEGGNVSWLAGNHENMFNSVIAGFKTESALEDLDSDRWRFAKYPGNFEMVNYLENEEKQQIIEAFLAESEETIEKLKAHVVKKSKFIDMARQSINDAVYGSNRKPDQGALDKLEKSDQELEAVKSKIIALENFRTKNPATIEFDSIVDFFEPDSKTGIFITKLITDNRETIIKNMKSDPEGQDMLEALTDQKLVEIQDDVLYVHTNLTGNMVSIINTFAEQYAGGNITVGVQKLNKFYQTILSAYMIGEPPLDTIEENSKNYFHRLRDEFLSTSTNSRINYTSMDSGLTTGQKNQLTNLLKGHGINLVVHGHQNEHGVPKGTSELPILSIDRDVYKGENGSLEIPIAHTTITKNGQALYH